MVVTRLYAREEVIVKSPMLTSSINYARFERIVVLEQLKLVFLYTDYTCRCCYMESDERQRALLVRFRVVTVPCAVVNLRKMIIK